MNEKRTSKFLSLVLRHKPETIGVELDESGWIDVDVLLDAMAKHGKEVSREQLMSVVRNNDKQRFLIEENRIRANQGHSISVNLGLEASVPPDQLYHGTATRFIDSILEKGLQKMGRQHVHLSTNIETASRVGVRYGKLVILIVDSGAMAREGYRFFLSRNGVWLVDHVPPNFVQELPPN